MHGLWSVYRLGCPKQWLLGFDFFDGYMERGYFLSMKLECAPPKALLRSPQHVSPSQGCDCHFHLFGPHQNFPLQPTRDYTPPEALWADYAALQKRLGLSRCVLVHPSVYGTDNRLLLATLQKNQGSMRGVAVLDSTVTQAQLQSMHALGVRGIRFNLIHSGGPAQAQLQSMAERIAVMGWHTQVFVSASRLFALKELLQNLPTPLVIDHLGLPDPAHGVEQAGFQWLLSQLQRGHCWVKLSGSYRLQGALAPHYLVAQPFAQALLRNAPERLVWGSDWPHPGMRTSQMPDDVTLFDLLDAWGCTTTQRQRILVDNPAHLYGF